MKLIATFLIVILVLTACHCNASDPNPLQDFCVADLKSPIFVNGKVCKDPKLAAPDDFFFHGLDIPGNTKNTLGSNVTLVDVQRPPGENTLGVAVARLDFAVHGLNPPHTHPRATEILAVPEGTLLVGLVSSNPDNRLFAKKLNKGDVYPFPKGMIHFQFNVGDVDAVTLAGFDSQSLGLIVIADAVFGDDPRISEEILAKAFQLDEKTVEVLQAKFAKKSK